MNKAKGNEAYKWTNTTIKRHVILLAAVNVIVFLVLSFLGMTEDGEFMLKQAMYVPYLIQEESTTGYFPVFLHFWVWSSCQ